MGLASKREEETRIPLLPSHGNRLGWETATGQFFCLFCVESMSGQNNIKHVVDGQQVLKIRVFGVRDWGLGDSESLDKIVY